MSDQSIDDEEVLRTVEDVMLSHPNKRSTAKEAYLDLIAGRISGISGMSGIRMRRGAVDGKQHVWLQWGEYIVDPFADDYHPFVMASTERLKQSTTPLSLGLAVVRAGDAPYYVPTDRPMESAVVPIQQTTKPEPRDVEEVEVWRVDFAVGTVTRSMDPKRIAYPKTCRDIRQCVWKYRGMADSVAIVRSRGVLDDADIGRFLLPLHLAWENATIGDGMAESFLAAMNVMTVFPAVRTVAFAMLKGVYPFPITNLEYQTREICDRCMESPVRDLMVAYCERRHCRLTVEDGVLYLARKRTMELQYVMPMHHHNEEEEIVNGIREYLDDPDRPPELRMGLGCRFIQNDVVAKSKTICIGGRHISEHAPLLREIVSDRIQYGMATVGDFDGDQCVLTVHCDLRFFIGIQRGRAMRMLKQMITSGKAEDRNTPTILLSKGMFPKGNGIAPLSAHDTSWKTFHPSVYLKGSMNGFFDATTISELEPIVMHDRCALVCAADLSKLSVHPTLESVVAHLVFEVQLHSGRSVLATFKMVGSEPCLQIPTNSFHVDTVRIYGGPRGHANVDMDRTTSDGLFLDRESLIAGISCDDSFAKYIL